MNIYALEGYKVRVTEKTARNGYDSDKKRVQEKLELNKIYTVDYTEVDSWSTRVYLKEIEGEYFNSVNFEEVSEQAEELDKQHEDYHKYHF